MHQAFTPSITIFTVEAFVHILRPLTKPMPGRGYPKLMPGGALPQCEWITETSINMHLCAYLHTHVCVEILACNFMQSSLFLIKNIYIYVYIDISSLNKSILIHLNSVHNYTEKLLLCAQNLHAELMRIPVLLHHYRKASMCCEQPTAHAHIHKICVCQK